MPHKNQPEQARNIPSGRALNATGLAEYAEGSIVSRTLADTQGGTLTVFAFAQGQSLSEHTAPFDAYVHVLDGQAELSIAGQKIIAKKGEMVLMPAHVPHAIKAVEPFKMILTLFRQESE